VKRDKSKDAAPREPSIIGTLVIFAGMGIWAGCEITRLALRRLLGRAGDGGR
jgi:hypothetical protein